MNELANLDDFQTSVTDFCQKFKAIVILNEEQDQQAESAALRVREMKRDIEEKHKLLVGPYKEITKAIDARKKSLVDPLEGLLDILRRERGMWAVQKAEKAALERRKIEAERQAELDKKNREEAAARALGIQDAAPVLEYAARDQQLERQDRQVERAGQTKGLRMTWKAEIVTAAEVPRQFLVPDEAAIRRAVTGGVREIPGVRIWEEASVSIR